MLNLDTHILLYALAGDLTRSEDDLLRANEWSISAIVLWEVAKLAQLGRIETDLGDPVVKRALRSVHVWPLTPDVARQSTQLDIEGAPADELIAATSVVHNVPLVTRDRRLRRSKLVPLARAPRSGDPIR